MHVSLAFRMLPLLVATIHPYAADTRLAGGVDITMLIIADMKYFRG